MGMGHIISQGCENSVNKMKLLIVLVIAKGIFRGSSKMKGLLYNKSGCGTHVKKYY